MESLEELRAGINKIDESLVKAFNERMDIVKKIGEVKKEKGLPVFDEAREKLVIDKVRGLSTDEYKDCTEELYIKIMEISKKLEAE